MSIWSIIVAIIMLGLLVTVHELGHFWVARLLKIKAYEVAFFIGPKLIDWRKNDVEYSIRAIPFGAYVRFTDFDEKGEVIGNPKDEDYGFTEYCYSEEIIKHAACEYMIPYYNPNDEKFISSQIIRDFIKNPKRKQPKTRSIRLARFVVRRYEKWKAEQATD